MEKNKESFWKKVGFSIAKFDKYENFLDEGKKETTWYLVKLIAILSIVTAICMTYTFIRDTKKVKNYFDENINQISFNKDNNELQVNNNEKMEIYSNNILGGKIIIDTSNLEDTSIATYEDDLKNYNNGIIILKDKVVLLSNQLTASTEYKYSSLQNQYPIDSFEKADIESFLEGNQMLVMYISVFVVMAISMFITYLISVLITIVLLMILGYLTSKMVKAKISGKGIYSIAVHSLTLPIMLNVIYVVLNIIFNIEITYFRTMYTAIAYIYIIASILMIKSDLIKREQVVTQIVEVQKKIRDEIDSNTDEDKGQEEKEPKEDEDDEKKDKKENENDDGLEGEV